jgi:excisionase family DNA binding protein
MKLISPREAARLLKKHHSTVYRMIERGEVQFETVEVKRLRVLWDEQAGRIVKSKRLPGG